MAAPREIVIDCPGRVHPRRHPPGEPPPSSSGVNPRVCGWLDIGGSGAGAGRVGARRVGLVDRPVAAPQVSSARMSDAVNRESDIAPPDITAENSSAFAPLRAITFSSIVSCATSR